VVLVAGEETDEVLGTWRRAAAAVTHPVVPERGARGVKVTDAAAPAAAQLGPNLGRGRIDLD